MKATFFMEKFEFAMHTNLMPKNAVREYWE